jgi:hypothetical protein
MDYTKAIETIKLKRRQGLFQIVARKSGISLPTVRKYLLDGNIISPKAKAVIEIALKEVSDD